MKVLYITNYTTMYGANTSLYYMMLCLKEKYGIIPYLLLPKGNGNSKMAEFCQNAGIMCFQYDFRISVLDEETKYLAFRKLTRRVMRYVDFYKILSLFNQENIKFDFIHSNSSIFDIGYFLAKKWKISHVWHIREFAKEDYQLVSVLNKKAIIKKYQQSSAIVAISGAIFDKIQQYGTLNNVYKINNGINIVAEYHKKYAEDGVYKFCIVGSIQPKKNQLDVVKACLKLEEREITNYLLYIVGDKAGSYYEEIIQFIEEHPVLKEKIIFTGFCDDVNQFLKDKDVGIMASEAEAFGRVTVEYMANYMPVIGTNTGGTPEILAGVGSLYEPHDTEKLSKLMIHYINIGNSILEEGICARERAKEFSTEKNAEAIYTLYKNLQIIRQTKGEEYERI